MLALSENQCKDVIEERDVLVSKRDKVEEEIRELEKRLREKEAERKGYQTEIDVYESQIDEVRSKYGRQLARLKSRREGLRKAEAESVSEVSNSFFSSLLPAVWKSVFLYSSLPQPFSFCPSLLVVLPLLLLLFYFTTSTHHIILPPGPCRRWSFSSMSLSPSLLFPRERLTQDELDQLAPSSVYLPPSLWFLSLSFSLAPARAHSFCLSFLLVQVEMLEELRLDLSQRLERHQDEKYFCQRRIFEVEMELRSASILQKSLIER